MNEDLKLIGQRLKGLRDVLDIEAQEIAALCGISPEQYLKMESGESELSVANLQKIAKAKYECTYKCCYLFWCHKRSPR